MEAYRHPPGTPSRGNPDTLSEPCNVTGLEGALVAAQSPTATLPKHSRYHTVEPCLESSQIPFPKSARRG